MAQAKSTKSTAKSTKKAAAAPAKAPRARKSTKPLSGSAIEAELLKASGCEMQAEDEDRNEFLKRLALAVDEAVDQEAFADLSEEAQEWYNSAAEALEKRGRKVLPEFSDVESEEEEAEAEEEEAEEEKPKRGRKVVAKAAAKTTNGAGKGTGTKRGEGVKPRLYEFLTKGGKGTAEQIAEKLGANLGTVRSKLFALGSEKWCIEKPLNIIRDENGVYSLKKSARAK